MEKVAFGWQELDKVCRALGLPDDLRVRSLTLRVDMKQLVTVQVELFPDRDQMKGFREWLSENAGRVQVEPVESQG
jgi:hypothetical protein